MNFNFLYIDLILQLALVLWNIPKQKLLTNIGVILLQMNSFRDIGFPAVTQLHHPVEKLL